MHLGEEGTCCVTHGMMARLLCNAAFTPKAAGRRISIRTSIRVPGDKRLERVYTLTLYGAPLRRFRCERGLMRCSCLNHAV